MSTGAEYTSITPKKLLGYDEFKTTFLDHVREIVRENSERVWDVGCVHGTQLTLAADGNDKFQVAGTSLASDGDGHVLDIDQGEKSALQFENVNAIPYYVGLKYNVRPVGIALNPRTGWPEYRNWQEEIGEKGAPDSVTDLGSTLRFVVDGVTEAGVSNAGRKVLVYKNTAGKNAITDSIAMEICTVIWTSSQNRIETSAQFGQETVSTDPNDYTVMLLGPTVKRNSDLRLSSEHCFLGIITGAGAGNPPSSFDHYDQEIVTASLAKLNHITRVAGNGRLKIDVQPITGESNEKQIISRDPAGAIKFWVDEQGNVKIEGDLEVTGTTTQNDYVQVNASETITDNLTAGDDQASDSHLIKGIWKHTNNAETANYFYVDGVTGRVGINRTHSGTHRLAINGPTLFENVLDLEWGAPALRMTETGVAYTAGGRWRSVNDTGNWRLEENTAAAGDFSTNRYWLSTNRATTELSSSAHYVPRQNNAWDLGSSSLSWRDLYIERTAYIDEMVLGVSAGQGLGSHMIPDGDVTRDVGSAAYRIRKMYARTIELDGTAGYGVSSNITPTADNTYSIGTASRRWANIFVYNLNFTGNFLPQFDNVQDLGSPSFRWHNVYTGTLTRMGGTLAMPGAWGGTRLWIDEEYTNIADGSQNSPVFIHHKVSSVAGGATTPSSWATGVYAESTHNADTLDYLSCAWWEADHKGTGTVDWMSAIDVRAASCTGGGTVTDGYGITISRPLATVGTMTDLCGLWIGNMDRGTNNWAIHTTGGLHELGGNVRPGTNNTFDLGSAAYNWRSVYAEDIRLTGSAGANSRQILWSPTAGGAAGLDIILQSGSTLYVGAGEGGANMYAGLSETGTENLHLGADSAVSIYTGTQTWTSTAVNRALLLDDVNATFHRHLIPITDDTRDLGSSTYQWRNLYLDGIARIDTLYLETGAGLGVGTHLVPTATNTYNLGGASYRWAYTYTDDIQAYYFRPWSTVDGYGCTNHWKPTATNSYDLGSTGRTWRTAHLATVIFDSSSGAFNNLFGGSTTGGVILGAASGHIEIALRNNDAGDKFGVTYSTTNNGSGSNDAVAFSAGPAGITSRHAYPLANNTYTLGSAALRWSTAYAVNLDISGTLSLGTGASQGFGSHLIPTADDTYDIGSSSYEWRDGYFDGTLKVDILDPSINASEGFANHIYPVYTTSDIGASGREWRDVYLSGKMNSYTLQLQTSAGNGMTSHLIPAADDGYDLGSSTYQWRTLYVDGTAYLDKLSLSSTGGEGSTNHFNPSTDDALDLGSSTYQWRNAYFDGTVTTDILAIATGAGEGVGSSLVPTADNSYDLGGSSYEWRDLYLDGTANVDAIAGCATAAITTLTPGTVDGQGCADHWKPTADDSYDLGDSSHQWRNIYSDGTVYFDNFNLSVTAGEGCAADFVPNAANSRDLGNTSYPWYWVYANRAVFANDSAYSGDGVLCTRYPTSYTSTDLYGFRAALGTSGSKILNYDGMAVQGYVYGLGRATYVCYYYGGRFRAESDNAAGANRCYGVSAIGVYGQYVYGVYASATGGSYRNYGVYTTANTTATGNYCLYATGGTKSWENPHPVDPTKSIVYSTVESERDTALTRGRGQLVDGQATITFPEHFACTASELASEDVHVIATPRSASSKGLAVVQSDHEGFEVVELDGGTGSYEFDYVVTARRRGFENDRDIIQDNVDWIPGTGNLAEWKESSQNFYDSKSEGLRRILKSSGMLLADGSVNEPLFATNEWPVLT